MYKIFNSVQRCRQGFMWKNTQVCRKGIPMPACVLLSLVPRALFLNKKEVCSVFVHFEEGFYELYPEKL